MASKEFRELQLSAKLVSYIFGLLHIEDISLGRKVLQIKDISVAVRTTFVPAYLDIETIERDYLNLDASCDTTMIWLVKKIQEFLRAKDDHVIVLENAAACPRSPYIHKRKVTISCFNNEVYHSLYYEDAENLNYIQNTIGTAESSMRLFGIMSSLPKSYLPLATTIDEDTIDLLADRCESMIVSAFDGTGYIICSFM